MIKHSATHRVLQTGCVLAGLLELRAGLVLRSRAGIEGLSGVLWASRPVVWGGANMTANEKLTTKSI
jgi:hypothetical protein